jgi:CheY-like chemotaxis protein
MKILGIDDNVDITELLSMTLGAMGHEFSFVNTGKEGVSLIAEKKHDVVLLDLAMPEFSGLDVLKELETMGNLAAYNIILFTASSVSESEINEFLRKGVRGIIRKPIEVDELEKQIAKLVS